MKDIKELYRNAKHNKDPKSISDYDECVQDLFLNDPATYILESEYIIKSSNGLKTLIPFIETYGLPISVYEKVNSCLHECYESYNARGIKNNPYADLINYMESFYNKYKNSIAMFEYVIDDNFNPNHYIKTYYGFNESGHQNRELVKGMIKEFGEAAIPDLIITANNKNSVSSLFKYLEACNPDSRLSMLIVESSNDVDCKDCKESIDNMKNKSSEKIVKDMKKRHEAEYRESVIMNDDTKMIEYNESEISALEDLISWKEYQMTTLTEEADIVNTYKEIISMYEEFDGLFDENVGDSVLQMLPRPTGGEAVGSGKSLKVSNESTWPSETTNKKTGSIPGYLIDNHDIGYGETEGKDKKTDDDPKDDLESYRRPSSKVNETPSDNDDSSSLEDDLTLDDNNDKPAGTNSNDSKAAQQAINNYYYYNYTNSLNKNSNSYNTSDDHSTDKGDNRNNQIHDNHSSGDNRGNHTSGLSESAPWELDIFKNPDVFNEDAGDADDLKPTSDHPIRDTLMDIDAKANKYQQAAKKKVQEVQNVGRAFTKPAKRSMQWIGQMCQKWKDADENNIKEKMVDPQSRKGIFNAIRAAIKYGSLYKAGILLNPVFLLLSVTKKISNKKNKNRIRSEIIGELKTEMEIIDEKIQDADRDGDRQAKYKLMRFKNELHKKLLRVGGSPDYEKVRYQGLNRVI